MFRVYLLWLTGLPDVSVVKCFPFRGGFVQLLFCLGNKFRTPFYSPRSLGSEHRNMYASLDWFLRNLRFSNVLIAALGYEKGFSPSIFHFFIFSVFRNWGRSLSNVSNFRTNFDFIALFYLI
jgi:hypothetical protein